MAGEPFPRHLSGLDALRGIAAVAVVFCHVVFLGNYPSSHFTKVVAAEFTLAVPMFFALSAFVLAHVYSEKLGTWRGLGDYALHRFFRIAPLFYFMTAAWLVWRHEVLGYTPHLRDVLWNISFLFGLNTTYYASFIPAGWSIGAEMIFYVMLPAILLIVKDARSALILTIVALVAGYFVDRHLAPVSHDYIGRMMFFPNTANFAAGLAAYFLYRDARRNTPERCYAMSVACFVAAFAIWGTAFATSEHFGTVSSSYLWRYFISAAFPFLILAAALWDWKLLVNGVTVWLGKVSYSVYLLHTLVIHLTLSSRGPLYAAMPNHPGIALAVSFAAILTITIVCAFFTYAFIERPGRRLATLVHWRPVAVPAE